MDFADTLWEPLTRKNLQQWPTDAQLFDDGSRFRFVFVYGAGERSVQRNWETIRKDGAWDTPSLFGGLETVARSIGDEGKSRDWLWGDLKRIYLLHPDPDKQDELLLMEW